MRDGIQGLGWFVRRGHEPAALQAFYRNVIGLPVLREGELSAFWAGETTAFEVGPGGRREPHYRDRSEAPCTPVFRVVSMARVVERLKGAGVTFVNEPFERPHSVFAYFLDPAGNLTGLAERRRTSERAEDVEAWRRWDSGRLTIPGVRPLPQHFQHLGWVVLRCADVPLVSEFYQRVVGLDLAAEVGESKVLAIGDIERLEIAPGAESQAAPADRTEVSNTFLLRVSDTDAVFDVLSRAGARVVNRPFDVPDGRIAYFCDPEGHLFGIQSRSASSTRPEDQELVSRQLRSRRSG